MKRKGQISMFETITVLFIFMVLIALSMIFYFKAQRNDVKKMIRESNRLESVNIAERASFLPELRCSFSNIAVINCIDLLKAEKFNSLASDEPEIYYDLFRFSNITLKQVYPEEGEWELYYRASNYTYKSETWIPVSIFNASSSSFNFGILIVESFS